MFQEMGDVVDLHVAAEDNSESDVESQTDASPRTNRFVSAAVVDLDAVFNHQPPICHCCHDFNCMLPHAEFCSMPVTKFIVCVKCQCMLATQAGYVAHVATCLRLTGARMPDYEQHIVQFEEAPQLGMCDCCGVYRQRQGALLDMHRHVCQSYISEHDGDKFPLVPAEITWTTESGEYEPPRFYKRLLQKLSQGQPWSEVETCHLAQCGQAGMWAQTRSGAFRSLDDRAPVFKGATLFSPVAHLVTVELNNSWATSSATSSTITTSEAGRSSAHEEHVAATTAAASPAQSSVSAETPMQVAEHATGTPERIAHVAPQRSFGNTTRGRRRRGRRSGQWIRENEQRSSTPSAASARRVDLSTGPVDNTGRRAERRSLPAPGQQSPVVHTQSVHDDAAAPPEASRRRRRHGNRDDAASNASTDRRRVDDVGNGALRVTSPRDGSAVGRGAAGDAEVAPSRATSQRGRHRYLEGAVLDHRSGNFIAAVLVSGIPAIGVNNVLRRYELERHSAVGVSSGLQLSYYSKPDDYVHISGRTLAQARGQALLIYSDNKMPAGSIWFWELPPVSGEWLLPAQNDARPNPDTAHVRLRFSSLRRA